MHILYKTYYPKTLLLPSHSHDSNKDFNRPSGGPLTPLSSPKMMSGVPIAQCWLSDWCYATTYSVLSKQSFQGQPRVASLFWNESGIALGRFQRNIISPWWLALVGGHLSLLIRFLLCGFVCCELGRKISLFSLSLFLCSSKELRFLVRMCQPFFRLRARMERSHFSKILFYFSFSEFSYLPNHMWLIACLDQFKLIAFNWY